MVQLIKLPWVLAVYTSGDPASNRKYSFLGFFFVWFIWPVMCNILELELEAHGGFLTLPPPIIPEISANIRYAEMSLKQTVNAYQQQRGNELKHKASVNIKVHRKRADC